jgi:hypothetical protein
VLSYKLNKHTPSDCYITQYNDTWTLKTCFWSLIIKQPLSNGFSIYFRFYDRFILKNKTSVPFGKLVYKLVWRLTISFLTALSWCYLEFIWYCILALWTDQQTPTETFIKLYKEVVYNKLRLKNNQYVMEAYTTAYGTLETSPSLNY